MKGNEVTLKDIIIKDNENPADRFSKMETLKVTQKIKDESSLKFTWIKWPKLYDEILKKLAEALDIKILTIITDAWIKNEVFDKIKQVKDAGKDETVIFPVTEHSIDTKYKPYIEVLFNETVIGRIDFETDLTITLKAANLKFRNRKLLEIDAGECLIDGSLNCESVEITKFNSTIRIPGAINFNTESSQQKEPAETFKD